MDEAAAVADRQTFDGVARGRLLQAIGELCAGLADNAWVDAKHADAGGTAPAMSATLSRRDEQLVVRLRSGLAGLVGSLRQEPAEPAPAVESALDGAEFVMRRYLLRGEPGRLRELLPSFAFLVVLPLVEQAEALGISRQTARLLDGEQVEMPRGPELLPGGARLSESRDEALSAAVPSQPTP